MGMTERHLGQAAKMSKAIALRGADDLGAALCIKAGTIDQITPD